MLYMLSLVLLLISVVFAVDMDIKFKSFLDQWEEDPRVKCVLIDSSSPRSFCAGDKMKKNDLSFIS